MVKKITFLFFLCIVLSSYSQSIVGSFNTGTLISNSSMHSIGEIYITPEEGANISSGIISLVAQVNSATLGLENISFSKNVSVFPIPTNGVLNINTGKKIRTVDVLDVNGRSIKKYSLFNNQVDISELNNGLYFIRFTNTSIKPIKILKN